MAAGEAGGAVVDFGRTDDCGRLRNRQATRGQRHVAVVTIGITTGDRVGVASCIGATHRRAVARHRDRNVAGVSAQQTCRREASGGLCQAAIGSAQAICGQGHGTSVGADRHTIVA